MSRTVVIGFLGTQADAGMSVNRWQRWRPSVAVCRQEDWIVDEYHLIYSARDRELAAVVMSDIENVSPQTNIIPKPLAIENPWDFEHVYILLKDILQDMKFDLEENEYYVNITTGTHVAQICLFLMAASRQVPAKLLQMIPPKRNKKMAKMYSAGSYVLIDLDISKYDRIAGLFKQQAEDDISFLKSGIETRNMAFNQLIEQVERVALDSTGPILLTGPTGAGKSLLASRIFNLKKLRGQVGGRFVEVNCATIRGDAAMSALFGHKKGSFTGAVADREGLLKSADKGIVFLDEVAELGLDEQAMLLRAIEEKKFMPLGSDQETESDFQLICGTNKNLQKEVREGKFREDLLARIDIWTFELPGLKDRYEDIEPNIRYELQRYAAEKGSEVRFTRAAWKNFLAFATAPGSIWRANFRDLNGAVTRMCTLARGGRITDDVQREETGRLWARWRLHENTTGCGQDRDDFEYMNRQRDGNKNENSKGSGNGSGDGQSTGNRAAQIDGSADETGALLEKILGQERLQEIDPFDRVQLAEVIRVCRASDSLSAAGRALFSVSRQNKKQPNDADRLKKYLESYGLKWESIRASGSWR